MPRYLALLGMALLAAAICSAEINIPHAGEAHFAPDATAERLMKEQQQADPVMDFLEDLMEQPAEEEALVEVLPQQPHLHMPKMPPSATEADHQVDPHAERLVKDAQAEDPVLSFMEAQMAASDGSNMFGGREIDPETGLAKALKEHQDSEDIHERQKQKDAATQAGLRQIQADQNAVAMEQAAIEKAQQDKELRARAQKQKVDRMAAISAHVFSNVARATAAAAPADEEAKDEEAKDEEAKDEEAEDEDEEADEDEEEDLEEKFRDETLTETKEPVVPGSSAATTHSSAPHPPHAHQYSATPIGEKQERAAAQLGKGSHSAAKEDWAVEQEAYRRIHPHKTKAKKVVKMKTPTPLKDAKKELKTGLHHIRQTVKLQKFHPHLMTLKEAKAKCGKIRANAKAKCHKITHSTGLFCETLKVTKEECAEKKLKQAATCKVAHETAYNECLGLFNKAKKNAVIVDKRTDVESGPVKAIEATATGSTTCSKVFAASHKKCTAELKVYKDACAKSKHKAMVAMVVSELVALQGHTNTTSAATLKKQAAKAAKKASKVAAKVHKDAKALQGTKMSAAAVKCHKLKAKAKQVCDDTADKAKSVCRHAMQGSKVFEEFIALPQF